MAQADQQIDNASFPAVRTDITDNLAALFSQSSGPSAPAVTVAYQPWIDTSSSPAVWKVRNGTNTGWITVGTIDTTGGTFAVGGITSISSGGTGATTAAAALAALLPNQTGNSGKALVTDGSLAAWGLVASGVSAQVITASGTYTPTAGKTTFLVFATGGGGGSGGISGGSSGASGGGGGGGTAIRLYTSAEIGATASVTIGAGGAAGGVGGTGGTTSFSPSGTGLVVTGIGGSGTASVAGSVSAGGAGGGATNSLFSVNGNIGAHGASISGSYVTSAGGSSFWCAGRGSGGAGRAGAGSLAGNVGNAGVVFILEW